MRKLEVYTFASAANHFNNPVVYVANTGENQAEAVGKAEQEEENVSERWKMTNGYQNQAEVQVQRVSECPFSSST